MSVLAGPNLFATDGTTSAAGLGDEYHEGANVWTYVKASGAIAKYAAVTLDKSFTAVEATSTTSGSRPTRVGVAQFAFSDTEYGWVLTGPFSTRPDGTAFKVLTGAASAVDVVLKTSNTAGKVDDGDDSGDAITGLVLTESGAGGAGTYTCEAVCRLNTNV